MYDESCLWMWKKPVDSLWIHLIWNIIESFRTSIRATILHSLWFDYRLDMRYNFRINFKPCVHYNVQYFLYNEICPYSLYLLLVNYRTKEWFMSPQQLTYSALGIWASAPSVYIPMGGVSGLYVCACVYVYVYVYVCLFMCCGSYNELIWWQCVSAIDPCVPHLVGTHTQPAVTAVQSGDHHTQHAHTCTYTLTHTMNEA